MESFKFLLNKLDTFWDKDVDGSNKVDLGLIRDHINNFLDWVISAEWDSSENEEYRHDLSCVSPLRWYSLLDSLILHHAPERVAEAEHLEEILLSIFLAEERESLCVWMRTRIAGLDEFKGDAAKAVELTAPIYEEVVDDELRDPQMSDAEAYFVKAFVCFAYGFYLVRSSRRSGDDAKRKRQRAAAIRSKGFEQLDKFIELDDSPMAKHFQYRFLVRDLRARTAEAVRSRPRQPTEELESEWEILIQRVVDDFGVHPFIAYVYKEYGNCLFDMGRHADCLNAYESAHDHLRHDVYNLQLAKLLWLWGSTLGRLGLQGAKPKLNQALDIARGRDEKLVESVEKSLTDLEGGRLKSFGVGGKETCRWGDDCRNNRMGRCKYEHPPKNDVDESAYRAEFGGGQRRWNGGGERHERLGKDVCKWGDDCRNYKIGRCRFYHP